ncbi:MAG: hypothetical protein NXI31_22300 [bacterium]|nr:hypothetical protein [bacterium]
MTKAGARAWLVGFAAAAGILGGVVARSWLVGVGVAVGVIAYVVLELWGLRAPEGDQDHMLKNPGRKG